MNDVDEPVVVYWRPWEDNSIEQGAYCVYL